MTSKIYHSGGFFYSLDENKIPIPVSYTDSEWRKYNFLPSFGMIGNKGFKTNLYNRLFGFKGWSVQFHYFDYYNSSEPKQIA